ncbi:hypothetical protein CEV33_4630 [Brucella grignonensis]|uniref:Uncharacterized protein n=1 Tax=Brucella grignonensis TaxID=94627 RepID=A0A256GE42_9HYPH|nr:hypothetical protein CEV33_4630 [Brucella grignonensis]
MRLLIVVCHAWIPFLECRSQRAIEGLCSGLQQQMRASLAPLHLLLFGEALADDGVDGGLDEGKGYPLSGSVALAVIDQAGIVGSDVRLEFADRRQEFPHVLIIGLTHSASQYRSLISSRARCLLPCQRYHLILLSASSMSRPA